MKKICFLVIWMGKFPDTFDLWLKSANNNLSIDFYLVTDQEDTHDDLNIHYVNSSLQEINQKLNFIVGFNVKLNSAYKLCDYKPVLGLLFEDIVSQYDYWGHCDLDLIFGNIRSFITDEVLDKFDKLFEAGCCILYKNNSEMNSLFKKSVEKGCMAYPYTKAFRNNYACYFDEYMGMNIIDWTYDIPVLREQLSENFIQDFSWNNLNFKSYISGKSYIFKWEDGSLYRYETNDYSKIIDIGLREEIMLAHIQKRRMVISLSKEEIDNTSFFWVVPNEYTTRAPLDNLYSDADMKLFTIESYKNDKERRIKNVKNNGIIDYIPHFFRSRKIVKFINKEKGFY